MALFAEFPFGVTVCTAHLESLKNEIVRGFQMEHILCKKRNDFKFIFMGDSNCDTTWNEPLEAVMKERNFFDVWERHSSQ